MKQLYWVAVLYRKGNKTTVVQWPQAELAAGEEVARKAAIKGIETKYKKRYDRLEVIVRPF